MLVKLIILVLVVIYSAGLFVGGVFWEKKHTPAKSATLLSNLNNPSSPMFANLQGSLEGKITNIEGNKLYFESKKGGKGIFSVADQIIVSEYQNGKVQSIGHQEAVKKGENATIVIRGFNNGFAVTQVTYYPQTALKIPFKEATQSVK